MTEFHNWDWPRKVKGGYLVSVVFKTFDDAMRFLQSHGLVGDNSAEMQLDQWSKHAKREIEKEATWLKKAIRRFFGRA